MDITVDDLLVAYAEGIFPMAPSRESEELHWYSPEERGVIPLEKPHLPRRLLRMVLSGRYDVVSNYDFSEVIQACSEECSGREETWISPRIRSLYTQLHHKGYAHSVEVREKTGRLVGGLYGVSLRGAFFGESMFSRERDASKIALVHLMAALRIGRYSILDTQYETPHLKTLGCVSIPYEQYKKKLRYALRMEACWPEDISLDFLKLEIQKLRPSV